MKLQINTTLALYSVLEFAAAPERHIPAAEIAEKYGVSPHHLAKVLAELARAGIVESVRGVGGGYRFTANVRRLTLMDVIQLFEDATPGNHHTGSMATLVTTAEPLSSSTRLSVRLQGKSRWKAMAWRISGRSMCALVTAMVGRMS